MLFGDPAQLAPVGQSGRMVFDRVGAPNVMHLDRVHRQDADNPILDLAHALADPQLGFEDFERVGMGAGGELAGPPRQRQGLPAIAYRVVGMG